MAFPRAREFDSTLALLSEGYEFIGNRCDALNADAFETRLMMRRVICARGPDAARMFYQPNRFTRRGAMPPTTLTLLQDRGSVQMLDGDAHAHRKRLFLDLMSPGSMRRATQILQEEWQAAESRWRRQGSVVLHDEAQELFCRTACRWAGIAYDEQEIRARTRECAAMIEHAGAVGPMYVKARLLRARTERWARGLVAAQRAAHPRSLDTTDDARAGALARIASHRDSTGALIDLPAAGVELLNVVRPMVAVARFVVFCALAVHEHPKHRPVLARDDPEFARAFVQEVRRFYPFFPAIGGRVLDAFDWQGERLERGTWVVLDLYGTNHSREIWSDPHVFRPERFLGRAVGPYDLVAQGAGSFEQDHRCPGEDVTIALLQAVVGELARSAYEVPREQDLSMRLSRMPALPQSGFVIRM